MKHINKMRYNLMFLLIPAFLLINACDGGQGKAVEKKKTAGQETVKAPEFNHDSAFSFVKAQVTFGPRTPGSEAHGLCASYLARTLERFTDSVIMQDFKARNYEGTTLNGKNIIGIINPDSRARITLAAHWDSRPFADHDPDPVKRDQPIDGANDGASGVGIILEIARLLKDTPPPIGVDLIFFDLEDFGPPQDSQGEKSNEYWGLGSQYWSKNPHVYNYRTRFVILLDMVGAYGARFLKEGFSMYYAPDKVDKVWTIARELGYGDYFLKEKGGYINDDHYFINEIAGIPAIDIIHLDPESSNGSFFEYWHTTEDTLDKIDPEVLGIVGEVVLEVVFSY
jgi:Zn-dependent M28 family amino/carboxypeptidase